ncbi:ASCH domain-containing protein [Kineococcus terrestris]|uniref:ASCH domain-containing protein n=1 Tax=Kineococcus terrestris TaxID=2044856 RepID=UPI0034DB1F8B
MTWPRVDGLRSIEFGSPGAVRTELVGLVLAGAKTATAGLLEHDYAAEDEEVEHVGERLAVLDDSGARVATVRVTEVRVVPFAAVDDAFARDEGEGYEGHEDWARSHERFWAAHAGVAVRADTPVVCLRFVLETGA